MTKFLLANGADVNGKNKAATTPLHFAAVSGKFQFSTGFKSQIGHNF